MAKLTTPAIQDTLKELEAALNDWDKIPDRRVKSRQLSPSAKPKKIFSKLKRQLKELSR
jgi:hypothetical protein